MPSSHAYMVELLAFGRRGENRAVEIPPQTPNNDQSILDAVFHHGQNDVQAQQHPSVSAGDVINIGPRRYLVCSVGFRQLSREEYDSYLATPRPDRMLHSLRG